MTLSFIICSAITLSLGTVTCSSAFAVDSGNGVAEIRISTFGQMLLSTFSDFLALRLPNMCSSSIITMIGMPLSSCVRRVMSYSEAESSVSRTITALSLLTLSQFTNRISPGRMYPSMEWSSSS